MVSKLLAFLSHDSKRYRFTNHLSYGPRSHSQQGTEPGFEPKHPVLESALTLLCFRVLAGGGGVVLVFYTLYCLYAIMLTTLSRTTMTFPACHLYYKDCSCSQIQTQNSIWEQVGFVVCSKFQNTESSASLPSGRELALEGIMGLSPIQRMKTVYSKFFFVLGAGLQAGGPWGGKALASWFLLPPSRWPDSIILQHR